VRRGRAGEYAAGVVAVVAVLALCGATSRVQAQAAADAPLVLLHATVIDGTGAPPEAGTTVVIGGDRIRSVYPDGSRPVPKGARVEDLAGRWVIPGLIDAHVHITGGERSYAEYEALMKGLLLHGVTGIRDMAGDARVLTYLARQAQQDRLPSPDIFYSALMAGPTFFAEDPRVPGTSRGVLLGRASWMREVDATTDIPVAVAEARGTGATGVKLYANLPAALVTAISAEAHRQGLMVWTHATIFPATPSDAVAAGANTISHSPYLIWEAAPVVPQDYRSRAQGDFLHIKPDDPRIVALLDRMRERGTILDATLRVFQQEVEHAPDGAGKGIMPWSYAVTKLAHEHGVQVDAGTDSDGMPSGKNGPDLQGTPAVVDEMALLVENCGFSPVEAIQAATQVSAMAVGQVANRGTITAGKEADLVVLSADPSANVRNVTKVVEVLKRGHVYR
jgi:imidazolonepropionase-like amidohydrolase